jgi:hypothetical protein
VYFVENRVFFRCREAVYSELLIDQIPGQGYSDILGTLHFSARMENPIHDFTNMLQHYTPRALTDQNDILRAMAGIMRRLSNRVKYTFFQGLPPVAFDACILFGTAGGILSRRKGFPSYSWTGWKGGIIFANAESATFNHFDWLDKETWIVWYKRSTSRVLNLVWDPSADNNPNQHEYRYRKRQPFRPPAGTLTSVSSSRTYPKDLPDTVTQLNYPLLQFRTLSLNYKLRMENVFTGKASILSKLGSTVGDISIDGLNDTTFFNSSDPLEFILLSGFCPQHCNESTKYFVMLLEWTGPVAERRGIGVINKSAVDQGFLPGPKWKEIILS